MASRVDFAVSATPIYSHSAGEGAATDVIAADVGRSLGGNGSQAAVWGSTEGYSSGDPVHKIATSSAASLDTLTNIKFLFIKHSGFEDDAKATANTTSKLSVSLGASAVFAVLASGDAIVLPFVTATSPDVQVKTDTGSVAVEYMATV
tara:strand:+ start:1085 stop:1528 length:444 start_codon:yes stop_codon:yes gene_type:complete